jgi:hypothetical protein
VPVSVVLDSAGERRSPATLPGYHAGRAPRNKGLLYPADPHKAVCGNLGCAHCDGR